MVTLGAAGGNGEQRFRVGTLPQGGSGAAPDRRSAGHGGDEAPQSRVCRRRAKRDGVTLAMVTHGRHLIRWCPTRSSPVASGMPLSREGTAFAMTGSEVCMRRPRSGATDRSNPRARTRSSLERMHPFHGGSPPFSIAGPETALMREPASMESPPADRIYRLAVPGRSDRMRHFHDLVPVDVHRQRLSERHGPVRIAVPRQKWGSAHTGIRTGSFHK
jgi:hypothetical protein